MTYREMAAWLVGLSEDQLDCDVRIRISGQDCDQYRLLDLRYPVLETGVDNETLGSEYPYLKIDPDEMH